MVPCSSRAQIYHHAVRYSIYTDRGMSRNGNANSNNRLDLMRAYAIASRHRFPAFTVCQVLPSLDKQLRVGPEGENNTGRFVGSQFEETYKFCQDCVALLDGLEDVASLIRSTKKFEVETERSWLKPLLEGLVRRLLRNVPGIAIDERSALIRGSCRLAVLISVDAMIREAFASPNYNGQHVRAIKMSLLDMDTKLGLALYWLMVAMLHAQRVDLGEPARALYLAEVVLLAIDVSDHAWRHTKARLVEYLQRKQINELVDTQISELWELEPISQMIIDDWT